MLKLKKEKMQAAKLYIIVVLFSMVCSHGKSQTLKGTYATENEMFSKQFHFNEDHTFISKGSGALEHGTVLYKEGYYVFQKDTLVLVCDRRSNSRLSKFGIVEKDSIVKGVLGFTSKIKSDKVDIIFKIVGKDEQPIKGAIVACMNKDKIVFGEVSDQKGEALINSEGKYIDSILISFLGYQELSIELSPFWGYKSTIEVKLQPVPKIEYITDCLEKYIVTKNSKKELHLVKVGDLERKVILFRSE